MHSDVRLQQSFWRSEFLRSDTATRLGIDNTPPAGALVNIELVLAPGLQRVRNLLGVPVHITSGYRCRELNRAIHASDKSQHLEGLAADIIAPDFGTALTVARELLQHSADIRFDQLIHEGSWVHVSFSPRSPRAEALTAHFWSNGTVTYDRGIA